MLDLIFRWSTVIPFILMGLWAGYTGQWYDVKVSLAIALLNWFMYFR